MSDPIEANAGDHPSAESIPEIGKQAVGLADTLIRHLGESIPQVLTVHGSIEIGKAVRSLQKLLNPGRLSWDDPARKRLKNGDGAILASLMDVQLVVDQTIDAIGAQAICRYPDNQSRNIFASPTVIEAPPEGFFVHPTLILKLRMAGADLAGKGASLAVPALAADATPPQWEKRIDAARILSVRPDEITRLAQKYPELCASEKERSRVNVTALRQKVEAIRCTRERDRGIRERSEKVVIADAQKAHARFNAEDSPTHSTRRR